ncbi:MAG: hypothetical protein ABEJ69_03490 [Candidatus Nanohaloarchaea archaeon]
MAVSRQPYAEFLSETAGGLKEKVSSALTEYAESDYVSINGELHRVEEANPPTIESLLGSVGDMVLTGELEIKETYRFEEVDREDVPVDAEIYEVEPGRIEWYD